MVVSKMMARSAAGVSALCSTGVEFCSVMACLFAGGLK
jgi:hypothetical protein